MRILAEFKEKPKRASRLVMIINKTENQPIEKYADALDPSVESDGTSAADVTMGLGAILFASHTAGEMYGDPTGGPTVGAEGVQKPIVYEKVLADFLGDEASKAITRGQSGVPRLSEDQIRQSVTVIPASYWGLRCWTCREDGHSTFTCPYLNADQRLIFAYRCYLQKVAADPQMKRYMEEKLEHLV